MVKNLAQDFLQLLSGLKTLLCHLTDRRGYEPPTTMAAPVRTNQVNQVIRHPRTTFGAVVVKVNKIFVTADARAFFENRSITVLGVNLNSKRTVEV